MKLLPMAKLPAVIGLGGQKTSRLTVFFVTSLTSGNPAEAAALQVGTLFVSVDSLAAKT